MATTSFTKNFKLKKRYSDNFVNVLTSKAKPILDPNFKSKAVDNAEYKKVVEAFKRS
ncbi:hypothetical protein GYW21_10380 [Lactobacillus mellis]|nr:hypothetical protein [Bombilactobacillus mellis]